MGAGKGKTKRASGTRTGASAGELVEYHPRNWQKFVKESGIASMGVNRYYLLAEEIAEPGELSSQARKKIITEVFADAVTTSTIVLPDPYKVEDFVFKGNGGDFYISHKNYPDRDKALYDASDYLGIDPKLEDWATTESIANLARGVEDVLTWVTRRERQT